MSTVLMVRIPSVLSPRHHTQEARQRQCHQRTPVTGSLMSNSSAKRIMTTIRHCNLGVLTSRMTPTEQAGRKSWYVSSVREGKNSKGKFENIWFTFSLHPSSLRRATTVLHGGFSLGLVCKSAIPSASERAKTTTIALCNA